MNEKHIKFFNDTLKKVRFSLNTDVQITYLDHDTLKGDLKDALGICNKFIDSNGISRYEITIDEFLIEQAYDCEIEDKFWALDLHCGGATLIEVICHEIAHMYVWRHGKKHDELTDRLTKRVEQGIPHGCTDSKYLIS